jgi:EpsI family protein
MLAAVGLAWAAAPTQKVADAGPNVELAHIVPESFGDWRIDRSIVPVTVSPDVQAQLNKIYNQTLSRTYVNFSGNRIMLSIAYGGDQSDAMQVHRPEVCYTAQGFQVLREALSRLSTPYGQLPVKRLVASQGPRVEPITYWIVIGDEVTQGGLQHKLVQLKYGLTGRIPDGMLVRVSSIDRNDTRAYQLQDQFLSSMLDAISPENRVRFAGRIGA